MRNYAAFASDAPANPRFWIEQASCAPNVIYLSFFPPFVS